MEENCWAEVVVSNENRHENPEAGFKNIVWASIKIKKLWHPIEFDVVMSAVFEMCLAS
jgi:hypothetical protein